MKPLTEIERNVIFIVGSKPSVTLKQLGQAISMKYRGVQDLISRLVMSGHLLRAGHGRGQQLLVTDQGKQSLGEPPVADVPKPEYRAVAIRHVGPPAYDTMTYDQLVDELIELERFWATIKAEAHPEYIWRRVCDPKLKLVETVLRRWPSLRVHPLWVEMKARAVEMRDFYFACACAAKAKQREYVSKLLDVIVAAPADQLAEFYRRFDGVPGALVEPAHIKLLETT